METTRHQTTRIALLFAVLGALLPLAALATAAPAAAAEPPPCTIWWDNGAGTSSWGHPANWTEDRLPHGSDHACLSGVNQVVHDVNTTSVVGALSSDTRVVITAGMLDLIGPSYSLAVQVDGGRLHIDHSLDVTDADHNAGIIGGAGAFRVAGYLRWTGGIQEGPGWTGVWADGDWGGLSVDGAGTRSAVGRMVFAYAGMGWTEGGTINLDGGSLLQVSGPSGITGVAAVTGAGRFAVDNALTVHDADLTIDTLFDTTVNGQVDVTGASRLFLKGGGDHHGAVNTDEVGRIVVEGGNHVLHDDSLFWVESLDVTGGDITTGGDFSVVTADVSGGTFRMTDGVLVNSLLVRDGKVVVTGGRAYANEMAQDGGEVTGDGQLQVNGDFHWGKGVQSGDGTTFVEGIFEFWGDGATRTLDQRWLDVNYTGWHEGGTLVMKNNAWLDTRNSHNAVGVEATISGSGLVEANHLAVTEGGRLDVEVAYKGSAGDSVNVAGLGSLLALAGGGDHHGAVTGGEGGVLLLGGTHTFHTDSQIAMTPTSTLGIEEDAFVTVKSNATVDELTNSGYLAVDASSNAARITNWGHIDVTPDHELRTRDNGAFINVAGASVGLIQDTSALNVGEGRVVNNGEITGEGLVVGTVENNGLVAPVGDMFIWGDYQQSAQATLSVSPGDSITVDGTTALNGILSVEVLGDYPTAPFTVVEATTRGGEFAAIQGDGVCATTEYTATDVKVVPQPCAIVWDGSGVEGEGGVVEFPVDLTEPAAHDVVIHWSTRDDTAQAGADYVAAAGILVIPAGQTAGDITVSLVDNDDHEDPENFFIDVSAEGAALDETSAKGTIADDDEAETPLEYTLRRINVDGWDSWVGGTNGKYVAGYQDFPYESDSAGWGYRVSDGALAQLWGMNRAYDVNNADVFVGDCDFLRACWRQNAVNNALPGPASASPAAVNDNGEVVGSVSVSTGPETQDVHPMYWPNLTTPGVMFQGLAGEDFGMGADINEFGMVAGWSTIDGTTRSWVWTQNGGIVELPVLPGFDNMTARALNNDGTVVGIATNSVEAHAWKWTLDGGLVDMGQGSAEDINERGDIVGSSGINATLWRKDAKINLNEKIVNRGDWLFSIARSISDDGVIVGEGWLGANKGIVVLGPEGTGCAICLDTKVEAQEYPNPDAWIGTGNQTTEGNLERISAKVKNNGRTEKQVKVEFAVDGVPLGEPASAMVAPGATFEASSLWDTTGLAWENGSPAAPYNVSAAVLDASGNEVTRDDIEMTVNPRPVVLVHGLWSDESTWASYQGFLSSVHPGWKAFAVDTMDTSSFVPNLISENAGELSQFVFGVQRSQNAWQVDVVGHSMGGLITRYYIDRFMPERGGKTAVANFVMLGTPNGGSPCAVLAAIPATYELRPSVVEDFNAEITNARGIPRSVAVGVHMPVTCGWPTPGDDVVPVDSAIVGVEDYQHYEIAHTSMTGSGDLFNSFVLPRLNGTGAAASMLAASSAEAAAADAPAMPAPQLLTAFSDPLAPGQSTSVAVVVPTGLSEFGALAVGPGALQVKLTKNSVVVADSGTAPNEPMGFRMARLSAPAAGTYVVRVTNTGTTPVANVPVRAYIMGAATNLEATAEQVGPTGVIKVSARITGTPLSTNPQGVLADITTPLGESMTLPLANKGGGVYELTEGGFKPGVYEIIVRSDDTRFIRSTTTGVRVETGEDTPGVNDAPIALATEAEVPGDTPTAFELLAIDPEGDELNFEVVTQPAHGQIEHFNDHVTYHPFDGWRGTDTFTFRANDGQAWSNVATATVVTGPAPTEFRYLAPLPAEAPTGSVFKPSVRLEGPWLEPVNNALVTFTLGGHSSTSVTSNGWAIGELPLDMAPGTYDLVVRFDGNADYAPSELHWNVVVTPGDPPNPSLGGELNGEAGYPVLVTGSANDPDGDARYYDFDFEDDGVFDVRIEHQSQFAALISAEHTYPDAFEGQVRLRVTDTAGNVGEAVTPAHIAPYRPLGALDRLMVDGEPVGLVDTSEDGRYVLYEVTDTEIQHQLPTPFGVLDRETGAHQIVSILPDGSQEDSPYNGVISRDGRFVAFDRGEWVGQTWTAQTYVRDLTTGATMVASVNDAGQRVLGASSVQSISDDGRYVSFMAWGRGLTPHETYNCGTVGQTKEPCNQQYVRDMVLGTTTLVSAGPDGLPIDGELGGDMTADGRFVAFNSRGKAMLWERGVGVTQLLGDDGNGATAPSNFELSEDGRLVLFDNGALVRLDRESGVLSTLASSGSFADMTECGTYVAYFDGWQVFLLGPDGVRRIDVEARDGIPGNKESYFPRITGDGRTVFFESDSYNLVPGDINAFRDTFVLQTGVVDSCGGGGNTAPTVSVSGPASMVEGGSVALSAVGSDADGDELTYSWSTDVGVLNGSTLTVADGPAVAHVTVTVSDGIDSASAVHEVVVDNVAPVVSAGPDITVRWGDVVSVTGTASDVDPFTAAWSFGATGLSASHAWAAPGTYTETLTVTDEDGAAATDSLVVTVGKRPVSLTLTPTSGPYGFASVAATVKDGPSPLAGRVVTFVVDGAPVAVTTDEAGVARVTSLSNGRHTVSASVAEDDWYLAASAAAVTVVVESTPGKATGTVGVAGGTGSFTAQADRKRLKGELVWTDAAGTYRATSLTALGITADSKGAWLSGTSNDGRSFTLYLEDNGESGRGDVFRLWIDGVLRTGDGVLTSGNVQVHRD